MSDANPENSTEPGDALADAKQRFSSAMVGNEVVFDLIQEELVSAGSVLPEFLCEPVLYPNEDGSYGIGLRLGFSATGTPEDVGDGTITPKVSIYKYLPIGVKTHDGVISPVPELIEKISGSDELTLPDGSAVNSDKVKLEIAVMTVIRGINDISQQFGDSIGISPMGGYFELMDIIERSGEFQGDQVTATGSAPEHPEWN